MSPKLLHALVVAGALALPLAAMAQTDSSPAFPALTTEQQAKLDDQMAVERRTAEARVARGEMTPDEAERYLGWRQWQIAQNLTGQSPPPTTATAPPPVVRRYAYTYPAPYYYPPAPYYYAPRPYYWGPTICAGGWGHHGGGTLCF